MKAWGIFFALTTLSFAVKAANYEVCNRTADDIHVAYALTAVSKPDPVFGSQSGIYVESRGWYFIAHGACKTFTLDAGNVSSQSVFFHATDGLGNIYSGPEKFCLHPTDAFSYPGNKMNQAQACTSAGGTMRGFYHTNGSTFNFNDDNNYLRLCNKAPSQVKYAITEYKNNTWTSKGWFPIERGECKIRRLGKYSGDLYLGGFYEQINGPTTWYNGPVAFCVDTVLAFEFPFADSKACAGGSLRQLGFYKVSVRPGVNGFDFNP